MGWGKGGGGGGGGEGGGGEGRRQGRSFQRQSGRITLSWNSNSPSSLLKPRRKQRRELPSDGQEQGGKPRQGCVVVEKSALEGDQGGFKHT